MARKTMYMSIPNKIIYIPSNPTKMEKYNAFLFPDQPDFEHTISAKLLQDGEGG